MVLEWNFDLALVILILLKWFFDLLSCYIISSFSLVLVFWFCEFLSSFVFSLFRFNFNLVFAVIVPFLDLGFLFLLFDYLVLIYLLFLLVFSVLCLLCCLESRLVCYRVLPCPALYPDSLASDRYYLEAAPFLSPYLAARLLRSTSWSLLSCLSLPLELPPPCSSPLPPRTGSVVIPLAHIVLSALPLCLDWFTIHSPCCFQSMSCK